MYCGGNKIFRAFFISLLNSFFFRRCFKCSYRYWQFPNKIRYLFHTSLYIFFLLGYSGEDCPRSVIPSVIKLIIYINYTMHILISPYIIDGRNIRLESVSFIIA